MTDDTLAEDVVERLDEEHRHLVLAESCTGGLIASRITSVPGASDVFREGIVCYSNNSKIMRLGVDPETLSEHGAVSEATAVELAEGAYIVPDVTDALSVTGIAGPTGGTEEKPVGTVWFALKTKGEPVITSKQQYDGDRREVRERSASFGLKLLLDPDRGVPVHER